MALGGLFSKKMSAELLAEQKLPPDKLALKVEHVGEYPPHDGAKKAGFRKGDIVVSFDGRTDLVRETDILNHALNLKPGSSIPVEVLRDGKKVPLTLTTGK